MGRMGMVVRRPSKRLGGMKEKREKKARACNIASELLPERVD
jgi:hypothetical protein